MKIGINILLRAAVLSEDRFDRVENVKEIGYDSVEIAVFEDGYRVIHESPNRWSRRKGG